MKTVNDIRNEFLNFFKGQGHTAVPSSPLVPQNDPTLMFTNSGMVQFKDIFTGKEKRPYSRATTAQKSLRAGGKHNDLENVGYTARHHTFFEMMGNFSFGDYFKEDAIAFAWELVNKNFGLPKDKLLVTVHTSDEEAAGLWRKIAGFSDEKIIRIPTNDNFWMMGDTGPCGPCSEIFIDQGDKLFGGPPGSPDENGDRFLEFWNLVFMQFEQEPDGNGGYNRKPLPKPSIDTGMGLERTAAIMQGKLTNYDIDLLRDIIVHSAELTGYEIESPSHKVVADHLRASAFLMADGVMPGNEGRGYVLRRIMRRAMRHAHLMGAKEPLMYRLLPTLISKMGEAYPELKRAEALVAQTLRMEEERFKVTLERGLKMLDEESAKVTGGAQFPGDVAFKLYDTYGFPLDLTQDALKAKKIEVDLAAFETCMEEQKKKARAAWAGSGDVGTEKLWFEILDEVGPTEFLGYETESAEGKILAIVKDGKRVDKLEKLSEGFVITNQTPFYAESGGQVGDIGRIQVSGTEEYADVRNTQKALGKLFLHFVMNSEGPLSVGDSILMKVDTARRAAIRANHSVTHLMHEALREVLGEHVAQKGSLQDDVRTRFDISHPVQIKPEEIAKVEEMVNAQIGADAPVETRIMALDDARAAGAMALFGEKYDDEVRVVSMGTVQGNKIFSIELCGGTHVKKTGEIGKFKIVSEGSLSSGIRRLEAVTGARVDAYLAGQQQSREENLQRLMRQKETLIEEHKSFRGFGGSAPDIDFSSIIEGSFSQEEKLEKEIKLLQKQLADLRRAQASQSVGGAEDAKNIAGVKFIGKVLEGFPAKDLKPMADDLKKKIGSGVIALVATDEGKASIVVGVTDDLTGTISAVDLVKIGAEAMGGKGGGGRPDMAQAGSPDARAANDGLSAIEKKLAG